MFEINSNLLEYKFESPAAIDLLEMKREDSLWGIPVNIDHITLTLKNKEDFDKQVEDLNIQGCEIIKHKGIYPYDYCEVDNDFDENLSMHFCAVMLKNVKLILVAPRTNYDKTSEFISKRGLSGIHHLGIETNDLFEEIKIWENIGFNRLSNIVEDDGLVQIFLVNVEGQVIELLQRSSENQETFTCKNANNLRISEN